MITTHRVTFRMIGNEDSTYPVGVRPTQTRAVVTGDIRGDGSHTTSVTDIPAILAVTLWGASADAWKIELQEVDGHRVAARHGYPEDPRRSAYIACECGHVSKSQNMRATVAAFLAHTEAN